MTKINLDNTYRIEIISTDFHVFSFSTILKNGSSVSLSVRITKHTNIHLPHVYNLGFGPEDPNGEIDDGINLHHQNLSKVFSTIMLCAVTFLNVNNNSMIGIDGSTESRAYMYHRMFCTNHDYLSEFISTVGVDWYVKLLRNETDIERDEYNAPLFKPRPEPFDLTRPTMDLYRYYMFSLKN